MYIAILITYYVASLDSGEERGRRKFFKEPAGSRASAGAWDSKARKIKGRREREREKKEAYKEVSK